VDTNINELVSVILPAYNAEKYIGGAIKSVLKQTYPYLELIVVDDGSMDRTVEIVNNFRDPRILLIKHEFNMGVSAARNTAIDNASGTFIAFIDSDDEWLPDRLEKLLPILIESSEDCFIADDHTVCFDTKNGLKPWDSGLNMYHGINPDGGVLTLSLIDFLKLGAPLIHPVIPLEPIRKFSIKQNIDFRSIEDLDFYCNIFRIGLKLKLYKKSFYLYRLTLGSITNNPDFLKGKVAVFKALLEDQGFTQEEKSLFDALLLEANKEMNYSEFSFSLKKRQLRKAFMLLSKNPLFLFVFLKHFPQSVKYRIAARLLKGRTR
jgi:glycosyltransferase involved in cell wall biosynthesis